MLKRLVQIFGGDPIKRALEKFHPIIAQVGELESSFEQLSDEALRAKTDEFRRRFAQGESLDELLPEAFAAVREASKRTIGLRHYDVQIIGGGVLHQGKIAEMRTGEGKTLVATLPVYLNSLTGKGVHLITVNDYLARRDARWMAPIYNALGLSVGVLQMAARTENGKKAFLVDLERESPHEDQHQLRMVPRQQAYAADVTYGTNSEFGFDYLRDNMTMRMSDRVQRGHHYAIVDEVDNVLIDEARTPLIISGPAQDEAEWYNRMAQIVRQLRPEHYEANEKNRSVSLTEIGEAYVENLLGMALRDPDRPEDVTLEQARMLGYIEQAMRAQYLYRRNKDYLVQAGKVVIVDEFTGRLMPGRRWSDGLHQAVEAKEGVRVQPENVTYATITLQNYFRMYEKLAGMTGTALTEAEEFDKIYKLEVLPIPTNLEYQASQTASHTGPGLVEAEAKDEFGYKYTYYTRRDDAERKPVYWRRKDYPDIVYRTQETKLRSVTREILQYHVMGRPMLVGTTSVELSENVSNRLRAEPLRRLAQVLLLRHNWFIRNKRDEDGRQVEELLYLNEPLETLDIAAMRKLARELDISFNPEEASNIQSLLSILNLSPADTERLVAALQGGIPHEVLNARKHTEESQIIAGAGAFGAVTIATNMAGRGVDIRLGGELAEEVLSAINRVLRRAGYEDPYDMSMQDRWQALQSVSRDQYGIYESEVDYFFQYIADMERVHSLGGLHVIGSERHEARRIDNQLRGRAARQGDPGSSRFYLSMEDELMRLFGGQQADSLMQRMKIDDAMPLEVGLVSRLVEQSQSRVEGANFDVRKHLLEYDDVLNTQRAKIYTQRDRIFKKEDLTEDVQEMLRAEISRHIPQAMQSDEGAWKLIAWLDQIQPTLQLGSQLYPSFSFKLLGDHIIETVAKSGGDGAGGVDPQRALDALLNVAAESIDAEHQHLSAAVQELVDQSQDRLDELVRERNDALDTFFEGLDLADETDTRSPRELLDELQNSVRLPIRLSSEEQRLLRNEPGSLVEPIKQQLETYLSVQIITRLVGAIERRMEDSLGLSPADDLAALSWDEIADQVMSALNTTFDRRHERLLGESGSIRRDLAAVINRTEGRLSSSDLYQLLILMTQGARTTFDRKTHRRVQERTTRLVYSYYAATFLEGKDSEAITQSVQEHLLGAQQRLQRSWGVIEFSRLASSTLGELDTQLQSALQARLGDEQIAQIQSQPLNTLDNQTVSTIVDVFGQRTITEVYRQLLLSVITELWVDYLTQMEALRVSIGLEAYAQRDPLVQYKNRASALFADLLANMRTGVVTRMFTYRPRDVSTAQTANRADDQQDEIVEDETAADEQPAETQSTLTPSQPENSDQAEKGKRRRRRRR